MKLARSLSIPLEERRVSLAEFHSADGEPSYCKYKKLDWLHRKSFTTFAAIVEVFTTGTMGELTPVVLIDGRQIGHYVDEESGSGAVSLSSSRPVLTKIQEAYRQLTQTEGVPVP